MSVTLVRKVRLRVGAGSAKPGPAIGQALGPLGLNMAEFCKQFNEKTKLYEKDTPIPVDLSAFSNRSFTFKVKTPPTSWFLKKCAGVELGSARFVVGHVEQTIVFYPRFPSLLLPSHLTSILFYTSGQDMIMWGVYM